MIFGSEAFADYQTRCSTWEEAEAQHEEAVELVRKARPWWRRLFGWLFYVR